LPEFPRIPQKIGYQILLIQNNIIPIAIDLSKYIE
jgi:hypothetical protein